MTRRSITKLAPFPFASDFSNTLDPNQTPETDQITLGARELATLAAEMRGEGAAAAQARLDASALERIDAAVAKLDHALSLLADIADRLSEQGETGALPGDLAQSALRAGQEISDGQGNLFAACKDLGASLTPSNDE